MGARIVAMVTTRWTTATLRSLVVIVVVALAQTLVPSLGKLPVPTARAAGLGWADGFGGTTYDTAHDIAIDKAGNVYLAVNFTGTADFDPGPGTVNLTSAGERDAALVKLDPS